MRQRANVKSKISNRRCARPLGYKIDPNDPSVLILRNGQRVKQKEGLDIFLSQKKRVYTLTRYGLRPLRVNYCRKRRYGQKSCNGVPNGQRYPYITFRGGTYRVHILMMEIWGRPRRDGEEIDHLNGNIDDWRLCNLQYVTCKENRRRAIILRRLRKAAQDLHDPSLDPRNMSPEDMSRIYRELTIADAATILDDDFKHHHEY